MKFIHASDLHLDSPLCGLDNYEEAPKEMIRSATRGAVERMVDLAIEEKVTFIVLSGDLADGDWKEKKNFLNNIMIGNILSMCKGLDFVVDKKQYAHSYLDDETVKYKGVDIIGFRGEFRVNFKIPDFFGLGKGVSQGFGAVKVF